MLAELQMFVKPGVTGQPSSHKEMVYLMNINVSTGKIRPLSECLFMRLSISGMVKFNSWYRMFFSFTFWQFNLWPKVVLASKSIRRMFSGQAPGSCQNIDGKDVALHAAVAVSWLVFLNRRCKKPNIIFHVWLVSQVRGLNYLWFFAVISKPGQRRYNSLQMGSSPSCYSLGLRINFYTITSIWKIPSCFLHVLYCVTWRYLLDHKNLQYWKMPFSVYQKKKKKVTNVICHTDMTVHVNMYLICSSGIWKGSLFRKQNKLKNISFNLLVISHVRWCLNTFLVSMLVCFVPVCFAFAVL